MVYVLQFVAHLCKVFVMASTVREWLEGSHRCHRKETDVCLLLSASVRALDRCFSSRRQQVDPPGHTMDTRLPSSPSRRPPKPAASTAATPHRRFLIFGSVMLRQAGRGRLCYSIPANLIQYSLEKTYAKWYSQARRCQTEFT